MLYYAQGSTPHSFSDNDLKQALASALDQLGRRQKVLAIPPDYTRVQSRAGDLTRYVYDYYGDALTDILPALGTHSAMTAAQLSAMFGDIPKNRFRVHDWRAGVTTLGEIPAEFVRDVSNGAVDYPFPAQVASLIPDGDFDLILSIGQVVPHEVIGMANHSKNILIGTGGSESIHKSHFIGAAYGMERMMGRADTPVRKVLNRACDLFLKDYPIVYVLTVVGLGDDGTTHVRGLFIGDDIDCFTQACDLSLQVNFDMLDAPLDNVVVYLDPAKFKSTWLGNKAVYRTRMAIADNGQLLILAPGLSEFGEDPEIDRLIRKHGYLTTPEIMAAIDTDPDLQASLSAAAHLIHGSSEGRFTITYAPGHLTRQEIESVNYQYADLDAALRRYNPDVLKDGFNVLPDGERVFFIANPALGLWADRARFEDS